MSQVVGLPNNSYNPITNTAWVRAWLCKLQKGCTRLAIASDKVYQLLAHGRWFSPGTPASSTTKTGRHDIVEILLKVTLNTKNQIKSNHFILLMHLTIYTQHWYCIGGVMVSVLSASAVDRDFSTKHAALRRKIKTGWFGIRIICLSGATCQSMDCCISELAL